MEELARIKRVIHEMDDKLAEDDTTFKAAVVLLASAYIGAHVERLAEFTGYDIAFIADLETPLRENGIWQGECVYCDWQNPQYGDVAFWVSVGVARGLLQREPVSAPPEVLELVRG